jgi:hypothetical protein
MSSVAQFSLLAILDARLAVAEALLSAPAGVHSNMKSVDLVQALGQFD